MLSSFFVFTVVKAFVPLSKDYRHQLCYPQLVNCHESRGIDITGLPSLSWGIRRRVDQSWHFAEALNLGNASVRYSRCMNEHHFEHRIRPHRLIPFI